MSSVQQDYAHLADIAIPIIASQQRLRSAGCRLSIVVAMTRICLTAVMVLIAK